MYSPHHLQTGMNATQPPAKPAGVTTDPSADHVKAMAKQLAQSPERCATHSSLVGSDHVDHVVSWRHVLTSPPDHSTQQVAQLLMQCLAKSQAKQNFSNMDQAVLRQKYDEMQLKCQEFKVRSKGVRSQCGAPQHGPRRACTKSASR